MTAVDVQNVAIKKSAKEIFEFVSKPSNLPKWTHAFRSADDRKAQMATPNGAVEIHLETIASNERGTVDWKMTFPDGSVAMAYSRVNALGPSDSVYSFVLIAPPMPLEMLEGAFNEQKKILAKELSNLKMLLEG